MALNVIFKGPIKAAKRAAARAGFQVSKCRIISKNFDDVRCDAPCTALTKVQRAFGSRASIKAGRGAAPGTVLLFNPGTCERSELRGASRRRRKRR